jgi:DNA-binding NarL/FixJ family response regulator
MSGIRLVVVSDRRLSGLALAGAVHGLAGTQVVAEVSQVAEAQSRCERGEADAVLIDASVLIGVDFSRRGAASAGPALDVDRLKTLTPREREVFVLLGSGLSNGHISVELGVTEATVKSHVGRVLAKLNLESRLQAGLAAMDYQ